MQTKCTMLCEANIPPSPPIMDPKDEVKAKVDLVEVVASYLPLKKSGRNFSALCPFHGEKTPSFMVSAERQAYKCFGCGESGDVFTFLEKMEGWDFRETLEELAKRTGVKLKSFGSSPATKLKEKIIQINKLASKFYGYILFDHAQGKVARDYLLGRGIKKTSWEKFGLGYAPAGWENILKFLEKKGFSHPEIATAGLIVSRQVNSARSQTAIQGGYYDRFRKRIIFPIKDAKGQTLGYSARLIGESKEAKYINSPDTPIFNKGSVLFGLDVARGAIRDKNQAVLVEGEFDVISAQQVGIENVVASKGTALTDKQVALISRYCESVILAFDMDRAGDMAARRGIELLDHADITVNVASLGKYQDPDQFCQKDPAGFKKALSQSVNIYDFFIDSAIRRHDAAAALGKKNIGREVIPVISKIADDMVRAHYIEKLSKVLNLETALVADAVSQKRSDLFAKEPRGFPAAVPAVQNSKKPQISKEDYFLALFVLPKEIEKKILSMLAPEDFEDENAQKFWEWIGDIMKTSKTGNLDTLIKKLPRDLAGFVDNLFLININPAFSERELWVLEIVKIAENLRRMSIKRKLADISSNLRQAQSAGNQAQIAILTKKFDKVSNMLKSPNSNE